ncbi:hypothetical protein [Paenibacillus sp. M2]|uniref:hypothetical protein n=1 Tax=Paenibacillus sp. M2 TaxID=3341793 RepID=UPI00398A2CA3
MEHKDEQWRNPEKDRLRRLLYEITSGCSTGGMGEEVGRGKQRRQARAGPGCPGRLDRK